MNCIRGSRRDLGVESESQKENLSRGLSAKGVKT